MSKPRYYWYDYVKKNLYRYPEQLHKLGTMQSRIAEFGIEKAIQETKQKQDGDGRIKMMEMLFFKRTHTIDGAADVLHVSRRTAQRWIKDFIYCAAKHIGCI